MASRFSIKYFASHDALGMVSEEEYQRFKEELLEAIQDEWPDAAVSIDDDEEAYADISGLSGQAEKDVHDRLEDIVSEVIDSGNWQEEEEEFYEEEEESGIEGEEDR
ncbi:MAG: hypothetical protein ACKVP2_12000 [Burkholderiales bacterium]